MPRRIPETGLGLIERRAVTVGALTADGLELFEGVVDGDLVVTAGVSKITDGMTVKLPTVEEKPS